MTSRGWSRQRGATIFEALMFIAIAALVVSNAVAFGMRMFDEWKIQRTVEQIVEISTALRMLMASPGSEIGASGDITGILVATKSFPDDMVGSGGNVYNKYGGQVSIMIGGRTAWIRMDGIPQQACIRLASSSGLYGLRSFSVNGSSDYSIPAIPINALALCLPGNNMLIVSKNY